MFTNFLFKSWFIEALFVVTLGSLSAMVFSLYASNFHADFSAKPSAVKRFHADIVTLYAIATKEQPHTAKKVDKKRGREHILKAFYLLGIMASRDTQGSVIIHGDKGSVFIDVGESYKGYALREVFVRKAKFTKAGDIYWAFLSAEDEKAFAKRVQNHSVLQTNKRMTTARDMFEDVKMKNGIYYIPETLLDNSSRMNQVLSSIDIQTYDINGKLSFKISYLARNSLFYKLGLHVGDFIEKINAKEIHSIQEPLAMFQNIKNIKHASITVEHANKVKELKYEVY